MSPPPAHPPARLPAGNPAARPRARGGGRAPRRAGRVRHRQPLLFALALCVFLVVGVPVLVLVTVPLAHADDAWAAPGDGIVGGTDGDPGVGDPDGVGQAASAQAGTLDGGAPAPAPDLAAAVTGAQQVLAEPEPGPLPEPGRPEPESRPVPARPDGSPGGHPPGSGLLADAGSTTTGSSDDRGPGGVPPVVPNLMLLAGQDAATRDPRRADRAPGDTGDQGGDDTTLPIHDGQAGPPGPTAAPPGRAADGGSLVIALGAPGDLAWADGAAALPAVDHLRVRAEADPFGIPGGRPLLVRYSSVDVLRGGVGGPLPRLAAQAGPDQGSAILLDSATLWAVPGIAAGVAGWGPVTIPPMPTAADSLGPFLEQVWRLRDQISWGAYTVDGLHTRRAEPLPGPADPAAYRAAAISLSPSGTPPEVQLSLSPSGTPPELQDSSPFVPLAEVSAEEIGDERFYRYVSGRPEQGQGRWWVTVNAAPEHATKVMSVVVSEFVERPEGGVPSARIAAGQLVGLQRNTIVVEVADPAALRPLLLRLGELGAWIVPDRLPWTDGILPGVGLSGGAYHAPDLGRQRLDVVIGDPLLSFQDVPDDPAMFGQFRGMVHSRLEMGGVSPDAPHTQRDVPTLSPEQRVWLQAEGSSIRGYHLGGVRRSPAVFSTFIGATIGLGLGTWGVAGSLPDSPDPARVLSVTTGVGALGGYVGGQIEFALNARYALELTAENASFGAGLRGMVLPRVGSGAVTGALTAPLMTWTAMAVDHVVFGVDVERADVAALGARSATSGAVAGGTGAGGASLTIYLLGGAAAGWEVPVLGSLVGLLLGTIAYYAADSLWGDDVERSVRASMAEPGPKGRRAAAR